MKIGSVSNFFNSFSEKKSNNNKRQQQQNKNNVSFKGIYVEDIVELGKVAEPKLPAKFLKKDALLLNEIAHDYPYQDCFIRKGYGRMPRLEYRETPPVVQNFTNSIFKQYRIDIDPEDEDYPCEPLLLYGDSPFNRMVGLTSFISLNPSLPYTVKVGYELHKKMMEKKQQIMEVIGRSDDVDLGPKRLIRMAHEAIADVEEAVKRYLLESAYLALTDRASASQIYASNYPKVQSRLDLKRTLDLKTSVAKFPKVDIEELRKGQIDICEIAVQNYPNYNENKEVNKRLEEYMAKNAIVIG